MPRHLLVGTQKYRELSIREVLMHQAARLARGATGKPRKEAGQNGVMHPFPL